MPTNGSGSPPREIPTPGFEIVEGLQLLEEESFSRYTPKSFYPVRIGDVFKSRYQVLGKLGYGSVSTAWLCRDLEKYEYVTLKVYVAAHLQASNEFKVLAHLRTVETGHRGVQLIRNVRDTFEVQGVKGPHRCLIHDPLSLTLSNVRKLHGGKLPEEMLKAIVNYLLLALDFLHTEAKVMHTDIQEGNVMMTCVDDSIWKAFEEEERTEPSARRTDGDRVIYASRAPDILDEPSRPVLCDFGDAQFVDMPFVGEVMPDLYRAPEIILGIPWDEKTDTWGLGLMIWDLFEGKHLFNDLLPNRDASSSAHLARMVALLGPPPMSVLARSMVSKDYFDENSNLTADIQIATTSPEEEEENLKGEEKASFLQFLRKTLQWMPEDRKSAKDLTEDPWLQMEGITFFARSQMVVDTLSLVTQIQKFDSYNNCVCATTVAHNQILNAGR